MIRGGRVRPLGRDRRAARAVALALLVLAFLAVLTFGIHRFATSRVQFSADFHTFWVAARAMVLGRQSPYASSVTLRTQLGIYGGAPAPGADPLGFVYPPYSLLPVLPTIWLAYPWAQALWMAFLLTLGVGCALYTFRELPVWVLASMIFVYPFTYGVLLGNFGALVSIFLIFIVGLLDARATCDPPVELRILRPLPWLAGGLLAWMTVKPQLVWLLLLFFALFAVKYRLRQLVTGFIVGGIAMIVLAWAWVPGWPREWLAHLWQVSDEIISFQPLIIVYSRWALPDLVASWVGASIALFAGIALGLVLWTWYRGKLPLAVTLGWVVWVTMLVHPLLYSADQAIALTPLLIWIASEPEGRSRSRVLVWSLALIVPWVVFSLPLFVRPASLALETAVNTIPPLVFGVWVLWRTWEVRSHFTLHPKG